MKIIKTSKGRVVLVDIKDYSKVSKFKWYSTNGVVTNKWNQGMHRVIMNAKDGDIVMYRNGNKLDNRRENLCVVSKCEIVHKHKKRSNTKTNYKGVTYVEKSGLYQARCRMYGHYFALGYFRSEEAAAYAYNKKATELSEFARVNKIGLPKRKLERMLITDRATIKPAEKQSRFKGVYWCKNNNPELKGKWNARIRINGKSKSLGRFASEKAAGEAYRVAEEKLNRNRRKK